MNTEMSEIRERIPDLTAERPLDIWALDPGELAPMGAQVVMTFHGIRLAFRPRKENSDAYRNILYSSTPVQ